MLELLFPPTCLLCHLKLHRPHGFKLCGPCREKLQTEPAPLPTPFGYSFSAGIYNKGLAILIGRLKFQKDFSITATLAHLMMQTDPVRSRADRYDCILAVPLHTRALARRGFNQAQLLADRIARRTLVPVDKKGLKKVRWTAPQLKLSKAERMTNLKGSFEATRSFVGEYCLLIDDVYTTGSTTHACAGALMEAGAQAIDILTAARAL